MKSPILGDHTYGKNIKLSDVPENIKEIINENFLKKKRQALHAESIGFFHPIKKKDMFFESKLPKDFEILIKSLKK